jgi:hypothetical protein
VRGEDDSLSPREVSLSPWESANMPESMFTGVRAVLRTQNPELRTQNEFV